MKIDVENDVKIIFPLTVAGILFVDGPINAIDFISTCGLKLPFVDY